MSGFWMGRRVLVTGGAGFLGSHVVEALLRHRAEVSVTTRSGNLERLGPVLDRLRVLRGDLEDPAFCLGCVAGTDVVLHLAADFGGAQFLARHPATVLRSNVLPFLHLADAASHRPGIRFLVTGSAAALASGSAYGEAKRFQESHVRACAEEFGLSAAVVRLHNCYGPRDELRPERSRVIPGLVGRVLDGENPLVVWGDGTAARSFLYVDDAVRGILLAAEAAPSADPLELGPAQGTTVADLARRVVEACGGGTEIRFDASRPGGGARGACDPGPARDLLGFEALVSLEEGLRRTVEWMRALREGAPPGVAGRGPAPPADGRG